LPQHLLLWPNSWPIQRRSQTLKTLPQSDSGNAGDRPIHFIDKIDALASPYGNAAADAAEGKPGEALTGQVSP
jgi:hypothetical protein